jgi:hypothetical protein
MTIGRISYDGQTVAMGDWKYNAGNYNGRVVVYEYSGGSWSQKGADLRAGQNGNYFGYSVDINKEGDIVVGGGRYDDTATTNAGMIQVWKYDNTNGWETLGNPIYGHMAYNYTGQIRENERRWVHNCSLWVWI